MLSVINEIQELVQRPRRSASYGPALHACTACSLLLSRIPFPILELTALVWILLHSSPVLKKCAIILLTGQAGDCIFNWSLVLQNDCNLCQTDIKPASLVPKPLKELRLTWRSDYSQPPHNPRPKSHLTVQQEHLLGEVRSWVLSQRKLKKKNHRHCKFQTCWVQGRHHLKPYCAQVCAVSAWG